MVFGVECEQSQRWIGLQVRIGKEVGKSQVVEVEKDVTGACSTPVIG
jgi:hypothetical protein